MITTIALASTLTAGALLPQTVQARTASVTVSTAARVSTMRSTSSYKGSPSKKTLGNTSSTNSFNPVVTMPLWMTPAYASSQDDGCESKKLKCGR